MVVLPPGQVDESVDLSSWKNCSHYSIYADIVVEISKYGLSIGIIYRAVSGEHHD
jgi:hypothetical protein